MDQVMREINACHNHKNINISYSNILKCEHILKAFFLKVLTFNTDFLCIKVFLIYIVKSTFHSVTGTPQYCTKEP